MLFPQHIYTLVLYWTVKIFFPYNKRKKSVGFFFPHLSDPKGSIVIHSENLRTSEILFNCKGNISSVLIIYVNSENLEV